MNHGSMIFSQSESEFLTESEARFKTFLVIDVAIKMFSSEFDLHLSCIACDLDTNGSAMVSIRVRDKQPAVIWAIFLTIWLENHLKLFDDVTMTSLWRHYGVMRTYNDDFLGSSESS